MILISMVLVYLLSLLLVFVYFLYITLSNLKIKNSSMKNMINNQNDVICFKKNIYNKWLVLIGKKNIEDPITDGLIITATATGIF